MSSAGTRGRTEACRAAEGHLAARAAGALSPENEKLLRAHLEGCDDCLRLARELEAVDVDAALQATDLPDADSAGQPGDLTVVARACYQRGREIGRGGMGRVSLARDLRLGRDVALKELLDPRLEERFEREARLTARLQHPAIVSVHEAGRWPSGEPFYAMKYVAGRPLHELIADKVTLAQRLSLLPNFITVAEAIAYAHSEGVIHRDLKPHNVVVGAFGETVVIDWGLAKDLRASGEDRDAPVRGSPQLTVAGAGTPAYMAPEQKSGEPPDEGVDIFALGATLHHLLAGEPPGRAPIPADAPAELRAIVAKATMPARADRYPTAVELVDELRRFQTGQLVRAHRYSLRALAGRWLRRHRSGLLGLGAMVAAASAFVIARKTAVPAPSCTAGEERLAGAWDPTVRAAVQKTFLASGRPYAGDTFERVGARLDDYTRAWTSMHRDACEATVVRHEQSEAMLDLRMACLERRLGGLRALTGLFARQPDGEVLDRATLAVSRLDDVESCGDAQALGNAVPPPSDPAARVEIASVRELLHQVRALDLGAKYKPALALVVPVAEEADRLGWPPLQLEAAIERDAVLRDLRDLVGEAKGLEHWLEVAARSKDDEQIAVAWIRLIFALGRIGRAPEALALRHVAEIAVARAGDTVDLRGRLFAAIGAAYDPSDLAEAERWLRRGVELLESEPHHEEALAPALNALGNVLMDNHEYRESVAAFETARSLFTTRYGPENPTIQAVLANEANILLNTGRYAEALPIYRQQLARFEQTMGVGPGLASPLHNVALAEFKLGRYAEAEEVLKRDLSVREAAFGADSPELLETLRLLGEGRALLGRFDESKVPLDRARAIAAKEGLDSASYAGVLDSEALVAQARGNCRRAVELEQRAIAIYRKVARPTSYEPWLRVGQCDVEIGRPREAVAALQQLLHDGVDEQGDLAEATFALGKARSALKPHDPAALALVLNARLTFELLGPVQTRRAGDADKWLALHAHR